MFSLGIIFFPPPQMNSSLLCSSSSAQNSSLQETVLCSSSSAGLSTGMESNDPRESTDGGRESMRSDAAYGTEDHCQQNGIPQPVLVNQPCSGKAVDQTEPAQNGAEGDPSQKGWTTPPKVGLLSERVR